ncbi:hypothetical protein H7F15_08185 [Pontibacter sp. Tf4]|uniref:hypothetical protein n=1 Tax=Pontibacter sp. Tf4 TaxID=2761620 RepID=UPI001625723B|nr:hypothetical protein [Pontibacter sp. Tf4]MBB6611012.1 hypothetical protein [Pontibacter sp. Tf4]
MEYAFIVLAGTAQHLQRYFETDNLPHAPTIAQLEQTLAPAVLHLLRHDLNRLLNILYRIDVEERQVKQAMLAPTEEDVALQIARITIKRELQKAQTRFIYGAN